MIAQRGAEMVLLPICGYMKPEIHQCKEKWISSII
jgi:hypothetical protein